MIAAAFAATRCSSNSGGLPTSPTSSAAGPATGGGATATVQIAVNPNPVPFSGAPITDAQECAHYVNTWFYDTVLQESAGGNVTFTSRVDLFDGKTANNITGLKIVLGPHDTVVLPHAVVQRRIHRALGAIDLRRRGRKRECRDRDRAGRPACGGG